MKMKSFAFVAALGLMAWTLQAQQNQEVQKHNIVDALT